MVSDIRFAFRFLGRNPGFACAALLVIALGIGANTAMFSVVYSVLLRPLPFSQPDRLVSLTEYFPQLKQSVVISSEYLDWRDRNHTLEQIAAYSIGEYTLTQGEYGERVSAGIVSHGFFPLLGVRPVAGRTFTAEEDRPGSHPVVLLGHAFWQNRFGSDSNVIGRHVILNQQSYQVIGVMPARMRFPPNVDIWTPLALDPIRERQGGPMQLVRVVGRLKPAISHGAVATDLQAISEMQKVSGKPPGARVRVVSLHEFLVGKLRLPLLVLLAAVTLVLLISCANVANLLIARATVRRREIAIRLSLGCEHSRIVRQLLTESVCLSTLGGVLGLAFALSLVRLFVGLLPASMLANQPIRLDVPVLAVTLLVSVATGLVFGSWPAREAGRIDLNEALKQAGRTSGSSQRLQARSILMIAEVALSLTLLIGAGLMLRSFSSLENVDAGFNPDRLLTFTLHLAPPGYPQTRQQALFFQQSLELIRATPGVQSAGATTALPFGGLPPGRVLITVEGEGSWAPNQSEFHRAESSLVSSDYFNALRVPLLEGRPFQAQDEDPNGRVVIINEKLRQRFFRGHGAIGRRLKLGFPESSAPWLSIVGVVKDIRQAALDEDVSPAVYRLYPQGNSLRFMSFAVRGDTDPLQLMQAVRRRLAQLDRNVAVYDIITMEQRMSESVAPQRARTLLLGVFGALALILASVGVYALMAYLVSQRKTEMGIRIALGASPAEILKLVLLQGMRLTTAGVLIGVGLSTWLSRFIAGLLYGVSPTDTLTYAGVCLLLLGVSFAACWWPAAKAARTDPLVALRQE